MKCGEWRRETASLKFSIANEGIREENIKKKWGKCYASEKSNVFYCIRIEIITIGVGEYD